MYDRGVVELASIKHRLLTILPLSSLLSASTLLLYFAYRLKTLVLTDKIVNDPLAVLNSSLYFVTELGLFYVETVKHTAEAACAIEYPSDHFRVIVSDDAKSDELAASMRDLAKTNENLYYTARVRGKVHHFKAGNLNHCLSYTESLPGTTGTFIGALDADMIPDPQWLRALLPHMLRNPKLALAQPPQASALSPLKASASAPASMDVLTHLA
ncbi:MAG: hypothetical protein OHK93_000054 [Ramalina farinacea]|uniref:Glycosyltransferase 2-like domain-containing protein n=1 Tax=Ramalina farinacea TaxID=258253 RepID=A0AA43TS53_9LECA|nr:hypothetical protein [Ramalina farinacea]